MIIYLLAALLVSSASRMPKPQRNLNNDESAKSLLQIPNSSLALAISREKPSICVANPADFCDSTWLSYPNLNAAVFGIGLPSLNPVPNDFISEPGMRNQIFLATNRDQPKQHKAEGLQEHFNKDKESIAHSRAECSIYRVVIDINS